MDQSCGGEDRTFANSRQGRFFPLGILHIAAAAANPYGRE
jgi:hypothetical protein